MNVTQLDVLDGRGKIACVVASYVDEVRLHGFFRHATQAIEHSHELAQALKELHALVKGECPSLLNEDSGGNAMLDIAIEDILARINGESK